MNFSAEKTFCRSEDGSAGGGWGEECRAVRAKSAEPRRLLVQSRTPQKSFVFLLEEKIGRAQIKKCEQNFSVVWRALASGGGAVQSFRSKWVRAKFRIEHPDRNLYVIINQSYYFLYCYIPCFHPYLFLTGQANGKNF